jgi:A/G-specific adenine glycosylase
MLQQTQVATVLDYFARFLARFPDGGRAGRRRRGRGAGAVERPGLLQPCAQPAPLRAGRGGAAWRQFPGRALVLQTLPGIGRSTAAAIASLLFRRAVAILDGNVKRVLTRVLGLTTTWPCGWQRARIVGPATNCCPADPVHAALHAGPDGPGRHGVPAGALQCLHARSQPCARRRRRARTESASRSRPASSSAARSRFGCLRCAPVDGAVWLQQAPATACGPACTVFLPVFDTRMRWAVLCLSRCRPAGRRILPAFKHVLTHKDLHLHPVRLDCPTRFAPQRMKGPGSRTRSGHSWAARTGRQSWLACSQPNDVSGRPARGGA